eukprot:202347-Amphidinium_carterae.1
MHGDSLLSLVVARQSWQSLTRTTIEKMMMRKVFSCIARQSSATHDEQSLTGAENQDAKHTTIAFVKNCARTCIGNQLCSSTSLHFAKLNKGSHVVQPTLFQVPTKCPHIACGCDPRRVAWSRRGMP